MKNLLKKELGSFIPLERGKGGKKRGVMF